MNPLLPGVVQVYVLRGKGKTRTMTQHLDGDATKVRAALEDVGRAGIVEENPEWSSKLRNQYVAALKKRGFLVDVVDNSRPAGER